DLLNWMRAEGYESIEALEQAEQDWQVHIKEAYDHSLIGTAKSWFTGYNSNVAGHDKLRYMIYLHGAPAYRERLAQVAAHNYEGFKLS
ncbi:MAG: cyclohexanone monooxygenase, partial [Gammaproteobacteria bacterium]|nr:cyclohexanone monooxygenase [Gammaproteobacteria bacterium]